VVRGPPLRRARDTDVRGRRLGDPTHPIFHSFFEINSFDIIPQFYDRGAPVFRGLFEENDPSKRLLPEAVDKDQPVTRVRTMEKWRRRRQAGRAFARRS
jgi:hypothetical protein